MKTERYEAENRLAEVDGTLVSFFRLTGEVRRSLMPIWWTPAESKKRARYLAKRWAFKAKLGKAVLQ